MIGVTIGIGSKYLNYAETAAKAFNTHTGLDTFIITEEHLKAYLPEIESQGIEWLNEKTWYLKFKVFDILPDIENYVYFDSDWHCINDWNPVEFADSPMFTCVKDRVWNPDVMKHAKRLGIPEKEYFNAGFYIVNRKKHYRLMQYCCEIYKDVPKQWGEQCVINKAVHVLRIEKHYLSKRYNWMDFEPDERYTGIIAVHGSINYPIYERKDSIKIFDNLK